MFGFCPLASGSKGNCLYVGGRTARVLIDAGISARSTIERLLQMQIDPKTIDAILVTHEHSDHIKGLITLSEQLSIPVLANAATAKGIISVLGKRPRFKIFTTGETFQLGDLSIHPFSIPHDTLEPVAFTIQIDAIKLGICADIGHVTSLVREHLKRCHYLYIEANHHPPLVHASSRPDTLKQRILCKQGHLSNEACAELITGVYHPELKAIYLAHLSHECNRPELALEIVARVMAAHNMSTKVLVAHQDVVSNPCLFE